MSWHHVGIALLQHTLIPQIVLVNKISGLFYRPTTVYLPVMLLLQLPACILQPGSGFQDKSVWRYRHIKRCYNDAELTSPKKLTWAVYGSSLAATSPPRSAETRFVSSGSILTRVQLWSAQQLRPGFLVQLLVLQYANKNILGAAERNATNNLPKVVQCRNKLRTWSLLVLVLMSSIQAAAEK